MLGQEGDEGVGPMLRDGVRATWSFENGDIGSFVRCRGLTGGDSVLGMDAVGEGGSCRFEVASPNASSAIHIHIPSRGHGPIAGGTFRYRRLDRTSNWGRVTKCNGRNRAPPARQSATGAVSDRRSRKGSRTGKDRAAYPGRRGDDPSNGGGLMPMAGGCHVHSPDGNILVPRRGLLLATIKRLEEDAGGKRS
jgi:hypothetical protein